MIPACESTEELGRGKFLYLELRHYHDSKGNVHDWEAAQRQGANCGATILATLRPSGKIVLVRQFRPPMNAYCLEFPAGILDPGENGEQTALRELQEETGYTGIITGHTNLTACSPGMTGERSVLVVMDVPEELPANRNPQPNLQDSEEIEVLTLQKEEIPAYFRKATAKGDIIDSRVATWAIGNGLRW